MDIFVDHGPAWISTSELDEVVFFATLWFLLFVPRLGVCLQILHEAFEKKHFPYKAFSHKRSLFSRFTLSLGCAAFQNVKKHATLKKTCIKTALKYPPFASHKNNPNHCFRALLPVLQKILQNPVARGLSKGAPGLGCVIVFFWYLNTFLRFLRASCWKHFSVQFAP